MAKCAFINVSEATLNLQLQVSANLMAFWSLFDRTLVTTKVLARLVASHLATSMAENANQAHSTEFKLCTQLPLNVAQILPSVGRLITTLI